MKRVSQFLPPRQSVIYGYTRRMLDETASNANTFAMVVAEKYLQLVAPDVRSVPFRLGEGDDLLKAMKNNAQILRRYMDCTVKVLPADLEDAWVMALPEPYRSECERDLAKRRGRFSIALPESASSGEEYAAIGDVLTQAGELCTEWGKALADGSLTEAEAQRINAECSDVITAALGVQRLVAEKRASESKGY
jgi:hypothetical protein